MLKIKRDASIALSVSAIGQVSADGGRAIFNSGGGDDSNGHLLLPPGSRNAAAQRRGAVRGKGGPQPTLFTARSHRWRGAASFRRAAGMSCAGLRE